MPVLSSCFKIISKIVILFHVIVQFSDERSVEQLHTWRYTHEWHIVYYHYIDKVSLLPAIVKHIYKTMRVGVVTNILGWINMLLYIISKQTNTYYENKWNINMNTYWNGLLLPRDMQWWFMLWEYIDYLTCGIIPII